MGIFDNYDAIKHHPLVKQDYIIITPMITQTYKIVKEKVNLRRTGAVFYAPPLSGKTYCAYALRDLLMFDYDDLYVTFCTLTGTKVPHEKHMIESLIIAEELAISIKANSSLKLCNSFADDIRTRITMNEGSQYILILDELQLLNDEDFSQLLFVDNCFKARRIKLTTIGFAQPHIRSVRNAFMKTENKQFIARFLSDMFEFDGISNSETLKKILNLYDNETEYPENSKCSYVRYFVPLAFDSGLRLINYAELLFNQLVNSSSTHNEEITMAHAARTIEALLQILRQKDSAHLVILEDDIKYAVKLSELENFSNILDS